VFVEGIVGAHNRISGDEIEEVFHATIYFDSFAELFGYLKVSYTEPRRILGAIIVGQDWEPHGAIPVACKIEREAVDRGVAYHEIAAPLRGI